MSDSGIQFPQEASSMLTITLEKEYMPESCVREAKSSEPTGGLPGGDCLPPFVRGSKQ